MLHKCLNMREILLPVNSIDVKNVFYVFLFTTLLRFLTFLHRFWATVCKTPVVCLSVRNVRVCAPDFAMKALEYRNDFDAVG